MESNFIATLSHELRNPLHAIIGLSKLLNTASSKEEQQEYVERLIETSESLLALINNILDFSKINAGKSKVVLRPTDLSGKLQSALNSYKTIANAKGLEFSVEVDESLPELVLADEVKLVQVILNFISNALKFTETGSVRTEISVLEQRDSEVLVRFSVRDTGIGIAPEKLEAIFHAFEQADDYINLRFGGTGLGLNISKGVIELLGGKAFVESRPGKGSLFGFDLPLEIVNKAPEIYPVGQEEKAQDDLPEGLRVLVVDDNQLNILVVQKNLEAWGCLCETATNGLSAVRKVQENHFDIILMDLHMPQMDGLEAAEVIRNLKEDHELPIIALTASVENEVSEKIKCFGFTDLLFKPFDPRDLQQLLHQYCGDPSRSAVASE